MEYGCGIDKYDFEGRVIRADFKDYSVISVYFPSGTTGGVRQDFKMGFLADFQEYVGSLKKQIPNLIISAFFLFIYDGALGRVFGASAVGTSLDFAQGNFVNFILPVSIVSASLSGSASGFYIIEDIESGVFKRYQGMPISKWSIILAPMVIGAIRVLIQASLILLIGSFIGADPATGFSGYLAA